MLGKFNSFIEKWMAFVTPACLLMGVLFPDIAKHGVPYVTYAFAFMTFIGALKSRFRDVADVFKKPLPLILMRHRHHVLSLSLCLYISTLPRKFLLLLQKYFSFLTRSRNKGVPPLTLSRD